MKPFCISQTPLMRIQTASSLFVSIPFTHILSQIPLISSEFSLSSSYSLTQSRLFFHTQFWKRAVAYLQKQRYREALADLNQVISLNPQSVPAFLRRAKIYRDMGRFADAKKDIAEVLKLRPGDKEATQLEEFIAQADGFLQEGRRMYSAQRWRDAIHSFTKFVTYAFLLFNTNIFKFSCFCIVCRAIELAPVVEEGRIFRARASLKLKEYNVAVDDTSALLKVRKNNLDAIYVRAKAFLYLGETDAAVKYVLMPLDNSYSVNFLIFIHFFRVQPPERMCSSRSGF